MLTMKKRRASAVVIIKRARFQQDSLVNFLGQRIQSLTGSFTASILASTVVPLIM